MTSMAMPSADLTGIDRKNTFSCGAVRLTKPRPIVARNMRMTIGAAMTTVVFNMPSNAPSTCVGAAAVKDTPSPKTGQMSKLL